MWLVGNTDKIVTGNREIKTKEKRPCDPSAEV
jgi:hypothetical protein